MPRYPNPTYTPPTQVSYNPDDRVRTINTGFDEVWTALIVYASLSYFAIKSNEKDSGLLTLQFGSGNSAEFIDCGYVKTFRVKYEGPLIGFLTQYGGADLDGNMNIFIKRVSSDITEVRVNARYIFKSNNPARMTQVWAFDTGGSDTKQIGAVVATCQPTHKAERTILDGIDQIAHKAKPQS